jgi:hypothetical protein
MRLRAVLPHFITVIVSVALPATVALAWTGPTSAPPSGNVSAPINVGTTDQIKNAGLGINSLAVFGNAILAGVNSYLNFGATMTARWSSKIAWEVGRAFLAPQVPSRRSSSPTARRRPVRRVGAASAR